MKQIFIVQRSTIIKEKKKEEKKRKIIIPSKLFLINFQPSCPDFPSLTR